MRSDCSLKHNIGEKPTVILYTYINRHAGTSEKQEKKQKQCIFLKKNQNAPRPSEHPPVRGKKMSKRLGGIRGCKYKTSSWPLNRFPDADNIGSTVCMYVCMYGHHI